VLGAKYFMSIVPNKECVLQQYLPFAIEDTSTRPVHSVLNSATGRVDCRYFLDELTNATKSGDTYSKGDTHWNHYGALAGFNALMSEIGTASLDPSLFNVETKETEGDLSSKIGERNFSQVASLRKPKFRKVDSNGVTNVGGRVVFENEDLTLPTLVLFRDSFASNQMQTFASSFSRVVALWQPNIDYSIVEQERPDFVISQQVERFLVACPDDKGGRSAAEYEAMKKGAIKSTEL